MAHRIFYLELLDTARLEPEDSDAAECASEDGTNVLEVELEVENGTVEVELDTPSVVGVGSSVGDTAGVA